MKRPHSLLEPALHAVLVLGALVLAWHYWLSGDAVVTDMSTVQIEASPALAAWEADKYRALLFVSPTCVHCRQSMDFYAQVSSAIDSLQRTRNDIALAAVVNEADSRLAQEHMLEESGVKVDSLLSVLLPEIGVFHVPAVAVVRPDGQLSDLWVGLQDEHGEQNILAVVRTLGVSH